MEPDQFLIGANRGAAGSQADNTVRLIADLIGNDLGCIAAELLLTIMSINKLLKIRIDLAR